MKPTDRLTMMAILNVVASSDGQRQQGRQACYRENPYSEISYFRALTLAAPICNSNRRCMRPTCKHMPTAQAMNSAWQDLFVDGMQHRRLAVSGDATHARAGAVRITLLPEISTKAGDCMLVRMPHAHTIKQTRRRERPSGSCVGRELRLT